MTNFDKVRNSPIPAIHPSQVHLTNEAFSPGAAEVPKAKRLLAAMTDVLVKKAEQIGGAG